jgi:hypothetical protein
MSGKMRQSELLSNGIQKRTGKRSSDVIIEVLLYVKD